MKITVRYFAVLAEKCKKRDEQFTLPQGSTCSDLYKIIKDRYQLSFELSRLRAVLNEEFCSWDRELQDGDEFVIITPVAGG